MQVGDLVKTSKWCRIRSELAVITRMMSGGDVHVEYLNPAISAGLDDKWRDYMSTVRADNLILVSKVCTKQPC